jgi:hypothetical protein
MIIFEVAPSFGVYRSSMMNRFFDGCWNYQLATCHQAWLAQRSHLKAQTTRPRLTATPAPRDLADAPPKDRGKEWL